MEGGQAGMTDGIVTVHACRRRCVVWHEDIIHSLPRLRYK